MKTSFYYAFMAVGLASCSVSYDANDSVQSIQESKVKINITLPGWNNIVTRTSDEMLYPINVLFFQDSDLDLTKSVTITNRKEFGVRIPEGTYDVYVICGLPTANIPKSFQDPIDIPVGSEGLTLFAMGETKLTIDNSAYTVETLNVTATRQVAWLDLTITGIPESISSFKVYAKDLTGIYTLENSWMPDAESANNRTELPLTNEGNTYTCSRFVSPAQSNNITFVAEAITNNGNTTYLTYKPSKKLAVGTHLKQTLVYDEMAIVEGMININDWIDQTDSGVLQYVE